MKALTPLSPTRQAHLNPRPSLRRSDHSAPPPCRAPARAASQVPSADPSARPSCSPPGGESSPARAPSSSGWASPRPSRPPPRRDPKRLRRPNSTWLPSSLACRLCRHCRLGSVVCEKSVARAAYEGRGLRALGAALGFFACIRRVSSCPPYQRGRAHLGLSLNLVLFLPLLRRRSRELR